MNYHYIELSMLVPVGGHDGYGETPEKAAETARWHVREMLGVGSTAGLVMHEKVHHVDADPHPSCTDCGGVSEIHPLGGGFTIRLAPRDYERSFGACEWICKDCEHSRREPPPASELGAAPVGSVRARECPHGFDLSGDDDCPECVANFRKYIDGLRARTVT